MLDVGVYVCICVFGVRLSEIDYLLRLNMKHNATTLPIRPGYAIDACLAIQNKMFPVVTNRSQWAIQPPHLPSFTVEQDQPRKSQGAHRCTRTCLCRPDPAGRC